MAPVLVLYQLKVPELHRLVRTSCHQPPLQEMTFILKLCSARSGVNAAGWRGTWSGARHSDQRAPSWASTVSRRFPEASSKICSFPL